jgi:hypothetical protein
VSADTLDQGRLLSGEDIWREWCDGMLAQGRAVALKRRSFATLSAQDQELDEGIARRLEALVCLRWQNGEIHLAHD